MKFDVKDEVPNGTPKILIPSYWVLNKIQIHEQKGWIYDVSTYWMKFLKYDSSKH